MRRIFTPKKKSRETIEKEAFAAMRKAKAAIDPGVLAKVRAAIENSPMAEQLMGNKKESAPANKLSKKEKAALAAKQAHSKAQEPDVSKAKPKVPEEQNHNETKKGAEKVDQAKMLDIVAKTIELNPHNSGLKKGIKDILSKK